MVLTSDCPGSDLPGRMPENRIGHLPVVDDGRMVGMITQTDPEWFQAVSLPALASDAAAAATVADLYTDLRGEGLDMARKSAIFMAVMTGNSLKHYSPLGLLRGFATIRAGAHKNHIDLKMNGVVPVVDLGRICTLIGEPPVFNTRALLGPLAEAGVISTSGARDPIDAYDLIFATRPEHQAWRVRAGERPDNRIAGSELSGCERNHLRDAFVVLRARQSAVRSSRGARSQGSEPQKAIDLIVALFVAATVGIPVWLLRPWAYLAPTAISFVALDHRKSRNHPRQDLLRIVTLYCFDRAEGMTQGLMAVDCAGRGLALMVSGAEITDAGKSTGAEWQPATGDDRLQDAACGEG